MATTEPKNQCVLDSPIERPSAFYERAHDSFTYTLSELIFGSLLASYILGFVGFGIASVGDIAVFKPTTVVFWLKVIQILKYLLISATFAYLTASYYVTYHNSILMMPNVKTYDLRTDFGIALMQAVFFGLSMIFPEAFLFFIGFSLLRVFFRQKRVFRGLVEHFSEHYGPAGTQKTKLYDEDEEETRSDVFKAEREKFRDILTTLNKKKKYKRCLEGWMPIPPSNWWVAGILMSLGVILELSRYFDWGIVRSSTTDLILASTPVMLYLILFVFVWKAVRNILGKRAKHALDKDGRPVFDNAAEAIVRRLRGEEIPKEPNDEYPS